MRFPFFSSRSGGNSGQQQGRQEAPDPKPRDRKGEHAWDLTIASGRPDNHYVLEHSNSIKTTKYNAFIFAPKFLLIYFSRPAYLYFLLQAGLAWWSTISPFSGVGSTTALIFVLLIAAVKEIIEDTRRAREDRSTNESWTTLIGPDGREKRVKWKDVKMGHFVKVSNGEYVPADMLLLHSSLNSKKRREQICYIRTTNLDGETNLKVRRCVELLTPLTAGLPLAEGLSINRGGSQGQTQRRSTLGPGELPTDPIRALLRARGIVRFEPPNSDLHSFRGQLLLRPAGVAAAPSRRSSAFNRRSMLAMGHRRHGSTEMADLDRFSSSYAVASGAASPVSLRSTALPSPVTTPTRSKMAVPVDPRALGREDHVGPLPDHEDEVDLDSFEGGELSGGLAMPVTINELLLRGTEIRNTGSVVGVVVYVGKDTRIQQNTRPPSPKLGAYDRFLNLQISLVIIFQLLICLALAGGSLAWRQSEGKQRYYLGLFPEHFPPGSGWDPYVQGNYENLAIQYIINFFSFWILLSYLVPISLFVTIEIVRGIQGYIFINSDPEMVDPETGEGAKARNTALNESLGKITHAFLDKTGTLTRNEMHLRLIAIRDRLMGDPENRLETYAEPPVGDAARDAFDPQLRYAVDALQHELDRLGCTPWDLLDESDGRAGSAGGLHGSSPSSSVSAPPGAAPSNDPLQQGLDLLHFFLALVTAHELLVESPGEITVAGAASSDVDSEGSDEVPADLSPSPAPAPTVEAQDAKKPRREGSLLGRMLSRNRAGPPRMRRRLVGKAEGIPEESVTPSPGSSTTAAKRPHPWKEVPVFTGPSPDEVALVTGCAVLGFLFLGRTSEGIEVEVLGHREFLPVIDVLEFTGERRRMSVVSRLPGGSTWLFSKGADVSMLERVNSEGSPVPPSAALQSAATGVPVSSPPLEMDMHTRGTQTWSEGTPDSRSSSGSYGTAGNGFGSPGSGSQPETETIFTRTAQHLHYMSTLGLRTLVVAGKRLDPAAYAAWSAKFKEASMSMSDRKAKKEALADEIEQDLTLFGVVAVEDKLQDGVPDAISTMLRAGIRVWVITGDKRETAINIALSCKLFHDMDRIVVFEASSVDQVIKNLESIRALKSPEMEFVVDGITLSHVMKDARAKRLFAEITSEAEAVVVCRSSPFQKAEVLKLTQAHELEKASTFTGFVTKLPLIHSLAKAWARNNYKTTKKTLGVGDGANDVSLLQAADVGVGIMGKEGRQAVNASDFAIPNFRCLLRLLLVHGHLADFRIARLIKYSYYKNVAFGFLLLYYQFFNGYSAQALVDTWTAALYNAILTAGPIAVLAITNRPVRDLNTLSRYPYVYNHGGSLTSVGFLKSFLEGAVDGFIAFALAYFSSTVHGRHTANQIFSLGKTAFLALLGGVTMEIVLLTRTWTILMAVVTVVSYLLGFGLIVLVPFLESAFSSPNLDSYNVFIELYSQAWFWMVLLTATCFIALRRLSFQAFRWAFKPSVITLIAERERTDQEAQQRTKARTPQAV